MIGLEQQDQIVIRPAVRCYGIESFNDIPFAVDNGFQFFVVKTDLKTPSNKLTFFSDEIRSLLMSNSTSSSSCPISSIPIPSAYPLCYEQGPQRFHKGITEVEKLIFVLVVVYVEGETVFAHMEQHAIIGA